MGKFCDTDFVVMSLVHSWSLIGLTFDLESCICGARSCNRSHGHGSIDVAVVDWILEAFIILDIVHGGVASFEVLEIHREVLR